MKLPVGRIVRVTTGVGVDEIDNKVKREVVVTFQAILNQEQRDELMRFIRDEILVRIVDSQEIDQFIRFGEAVRKGLEQIKSVLLSIDSPGGTK